MPGLSAAVAGGIVEGDYTSWVAKWGWALPNGVRSYPPGPATYIDEVNDIFYLWWTSLSPVDYRFGTYNIADHSAIFESPINLDYVADGAYVSGAGDYTFTLGCHGFPESIFRSHQTYILLLRGDPSYYYSTVEIWRAGSLLWSRNVKLDTGEALASLRSAEMSLTGKYFMFYDTQGDKLWLYEGT